MSNINAQAKAAKKLTVNKETVRLLNTTQVLIGNFQPTSVISSALVC